MCYVGEEEASNRQPPYISLLILAFCCDQAKSSLDIDIKFPFFNLTFVFLSKKSAETLL